MSRYVLSWKIGGEAGFGIKSAGVTFARICMRAGYEVFAYDEYPSLIRGGHTTQQVTVSRMPVRSTAHDVDVLVALNKETFLRHGKELSHGAAVLYDKTTDPIALSARQRELNIKLLHVPFGRLTKDGGGFIFMRNIAALGATQALLGLPFSLLASVITRTFGDKSQYLQSNLRIARQGFDYLRKNYPDLEFKVTLALNGEEDRLILSGNEAIALGALAAGLQFYAAYPMTPSSSVLHYLASHARSERLIVKHAEDEISVINMALGASHVGARSMVGTSGGGFSLMVESLGLAGITETPLVILLAQRPGPATGLPTWTEQGDLRFAMHAAQGEFPRIILAPGDHEEAFYLTAEAFNWADQYQTPVLILSDKFLSESQRSAAPFDLRRVRVDRGNAVMNDRALGVAKHYRRYRATDSGVSPRSLPGQRHGFYLANSDEHDEYGYSTEEANERITQMRKRMGKLRTAGQHLQGARLYGNPRAKRTIIGWGAVKGPILDALEWLPEGLRRKYQFLHLNVLWPFPTETVAAVLKRSRRTLLIENNVTGQLGGLIRQMTGYRIEYHMLKFDGRPFYPLEVKERIMEL